MPCKSCPDQLYALACYATPPTVYNLCNTSVCTKRAAPQLGLSQVTCPCTRLPASLHVEVPCFSVYTTEHSVLFAMQYDMSITNETLHQPKPQPIPAAAPAHPTTVTQRRPAQFDQGSGNYNAMGSGSYLGTGQYTGASAGAGQSAGSGQYVAPTSGQYSSSGQFNAVSQPAYSGSPRFSSTPVDWSSSTTSTTPAAGTTYTPTDSLSQQSSMCTYRHLACTHIVQ